MVGSSRRPCPSLPLRRRAALLLLLLILLLECWVIAQEDGVKPEPEDEPDDAETGLVQDDGVFVFTQVDDIPELLHQAKGNPILLTLIYSQSCPHSQALLSKLETAAHDVSQYFQSLQDETLIRPLFGKIDGSFVDGIKEQLGVTSYPTLLFVRGQDDGHAVILDYVGPQQTPSDIYETVLHYWYRNGYTMLQDSVELSRFLELHGAGALRHVPPALNPTLAPDEHDHIQWLLQDNKDFFVVFVQCRKENSYKDEVDDEAFADMSGIMAGQRNVLFLAVRDCDEVFPDTVEDGMVLAMLIDPSVDWKTWKDAIVRTKLQDRDLEQFLVSMSTPSVLWFDRVAVAPIAFPIYRKVHAVLFVETDDYRESSQTAIRRLDQVCRSQRGVHDMVCLIVPQTERRILNTFGIDLWTPLDVQATQGGSVQPVLPTLLITDQRNNGSTRKYYLDATEILTHESAIHDFVNDFWKNELTPAMQSSHRAPRTNKSGVQVLTGASFKKAVLDQTERHSLVYFFAPSCGHCKRFSVLWNDLARLVRHMGWDTFLDISKMDVTQNEIVSNDFELDIKNVPDVYYFKGNAQPIRYNVVDEFGDGAGRLGDPLEIVEWFIDVASKDLDESELLRIMGAQQESDTENVDTSDL